MFSQLFAAALRGVNRARTDLRDALRGLRSGRGTTVLAFSILSITMAAGTVIFSVVDAIALRRLPYVSPDRLVGISLPSSTPGRGMPATPHDYFDWIEGTRSFEALGAARFGPPLVLNFDATVETLTVRRVTANLFDVLGVRAIVGRLFGPEHERPGGPASIVLSHDLWVRRFRADPAVIGRSLEFEQETRHVIGVLPPGAVYPITAGVAPDLYIPYVVTAAERTNNRSTSMFVVGRLRPGVTPAQARADVERISSALVLPLHDQVVGPVKRSLLLVLAAVGLVLLVACVNVTNLLLARATIRAREFATREALGASRHRLAGILLLEGLILALASSVVGIIVSFWGVEIAKSILPPGLMRVSEIAIDGRVLSISIAAAMLCSFVFSSAPAWMAARTDLIGIMKASNGPSIGGRRRNRILSVFLVVDVAFVGTLLVATTLVVTSFIRITTADLGFDRQRVMSLWYMRSINDVARADRPTAAAAVRAELLERAKSVPGVIDAAISNVGLPLSGTRLGARMTIPGYGDTTGYDTESRAVTSEYFRVMNMPVVRGRLFNASDRAGTSQVIVINDVAAGRFFSGRDPIGQIVTFRGPTTVIGVVKGGQNNGPESEVQPEVYTLLDQMPYQDLHVRGSGGFVTVGGLLVRTNLDPRSLASSVRDAIKPVLGGEPVQTTFVDDYFRRLTAGRRFNAGLMATFGLIAVAIAAIGVYGTMAFLVAQQGRAIGLCVALGASRSDIMRSVLRDALQRVALGATIGLAGAWVMSEALTSFVFGISPTEPAVYFAVAVFLVFVGIAAALAPALRAARLDPLLALKHD
jgi:predicted permease